MDPSVVLFLIICFVLLGWKMNLAINHPEKYERLKQLEKEQHDKEKKIVGVAASIGKGLYKHLKR